MARKKFLALLLTFVNLAAGAASSPTVLSCHSEKGFLFSSVVMLLLTRLLPHFALQALRNGVGRVEKVEIC